MSDDESAFLSDEEVEMEPHLFKPDIETWHDYLSWDLSSFWMSCQQYLRDHQVPILDKCTYTDFVRFCHDHSSGRVQLDDLHSDEGMREDASRAQRDARRRAREALGEYFEAEIAKKQASVHDH